MRHWIGAVAIAGLATTGSAAPAAARWQYTQWGMTSAEVKAASGGVAQDNDDPGLNAEDAKAELTAPYRGEAAQFTAVFLFDKEEKLSVVTLRPVRQVDCQAIMDALRNHYGQPKGTANMIDAASMRWDDFDSNNLVVFLQFNKGGCAIQYSKLPSTHSEGNNL